MSDTARQETGNKRVRTIVFSIAATLLLIFALLSLSLKIYLASPYPARQLSALLSDYLHQPASVQALHTSATQIRITGLTIADPAGFPPGSLLTAESLSITPRWGELLRGKRHFRRIDLEGLKIDLHKSSSGVWNFAGLKKLSARPGGTETIVQRISLRNGSFTLNGRALRDISLDIRDLATKGSRECRIDLAFRDEARNLYTLDGSARPGSAPAFALKLKGKALSLAGLARVVTPKNSDNFSQASGELQLAASLREGLLLAQGELGFSRIAAAERAGPLSGRLLLDASYHLQSDQAELRSLDLILDNLPQLHGTGRASDLKNERNFELSLKSGDLDLQRLSAFLPAGKGGQTALSGSLGNTALQLAGSGKKGITAITGGAQLREFSLTRGGRLWISGLSASASVGKQASGIVIRGELSGRAGTKAPLESIRAPFSLLLSPRMKLDKAWLDLRHARLMGCALEGRGDFDRFAASPFSTALQGSCSDPTALNPFFGQSGLQLTAGKGTTRLRAEGRGPADFKASMDLSVAELHGSKGKTPVYLKQGNVTARAAKDSGHLTITGTGEFKGVAAGGRSGKARLDYRLADRLLTLENCSLDWDGSTAALARLTTVLPSPVSREGVAYYPLAIAISGADVTHRGAALRGLSGRMDGALARDGSARWLEGSAQLALAELGWQGKPVATPQALLTFARSGAKANISGTLLQGAMTGDAAFNPFAPATGTTFRLGVTGAELTRAAALLPSRTKTAITEGVLDAKVEGGHSGKDGLHATIEAAGKNVTLVGNGKTLVSRAGVSLSGAVAGQEVSIRKARVTVGEGISITAEGKLENAFSGRRSGRLKLDLAEAPFNSYVDAFINSMPRIVQEAGVDGSLSAHATLDLQEGQRLLQGALVFNGISLDSPGQAVDIYGMTGNFPISLDLSGSASAATPRPLDFNRENFRQLYQQLSRQPEGSERVSIDRITLGRMELGPATLHVRAANGLTEIVSMRSPLYEGTLLGTGYLIMQKGARYRGDLLLSGLSLMELCNRFPAVKGYISGRVNGIVSLYGEGGGISALYGFVDLWAHEAKGEKMRVSRDFLQRLGGKKLSGVFFRQDIPYDRAEISALLEQGYISFDTLDIVHTNLFGVRDLNVSIAPSQNRIALDHLIESIKQASVSGKAASGKGKAPAEEAPPAEFKWEE